MSESDPNTGTSVFSVLSTEFVNQNIKTKEFLEASKDAVSIIEKFGKVFSPVTSDMTNNIKKLTNKFEEDPEDNEYLEHMILIEQSIGEEIATDALLWLQRALHFLSNFYDSIINDSFNHRPSNDLAPFLKSAYSATLERHHGWLGTQLFNILCRFVPTRENLLVTLALDRNNCEEQVIKDLQIYNEGLGACVRRLEVFFEINGLEAATSN